MQNFVFKLTVFIVANALRLMATNMVALRLVADDMRLVADDMRLVAVGIVVADDMRLVAYDMRLVAYDMRLVVVGIVVADDMRLMAVVATNHVVVVVLLMQCHPY